MITVTWQPVEAAASYLIQSGSTSTGSWGTAATVASGSGYSLGSYSYSLEADPLTWFQIIAVDSLGQQSVPSPAFLPGLAAGAPLVSLEDARDWLGETGASDARISRLILAASQEACSAVGFDIYGEFGGAVPEDIQQGVMEHVRAMYLGRGFGKGDDQSPYSVTMPNHTRDVLARYRFRLWSFAL